MLSCSETYSDIQTVTGHLSDLRWFTIPKIVSQTGPICLASANGWPTTTCCWKVKSWTYGSCILMVKSNRFAADEVGAATLQHPTISNTAGIAHRVILIGVLQI